MPYIDCEILGIPISKYFNNSIIFIRHKDFRLIPLRLQWIPLMSINYYLVIFLGSIEPCSRSISIIVVPVPYVLPSRLEKTIAPQIT